MSKYNHFLHFTTVMGISSPSPGKPMVCIFLCFLLLYTPDSAHEGLVNQLMRWIRCVRWDKVQNNVYSVVRQDCNWEPNCTGSLLTARFWCICTLMKQTRPSREEYITQWRALQATAYRHIRRCQWSLCSSRQISEDSLFKPVTCTALFPSAGEA